MGKDKSNKRDKENKKKKRVWKKILLVVILILLIAGGLFAYRTHINGGGMSGMLATVVGHDENTKKNLAESRTYSL